MLLYRAPTGLGTPGFTPIVERERGHTERISFGLLLLPPGGQYEDRSRDDEVGLVVLGGRCAMRTREHQWSHVGSRPDVFSGKPFACYVPPDSSFAVEALDEGVEIAVCRARGNGESRKRSRMVIPEEVQVRSVGAGNWRGDVRHIISDNVETGGLIIGETFIPPGNWSSYPPHKHDVRNPPHEVKMEELCHYRVKPVGGFAIQRVYTRDGDLDEVYALKNGDTVYIPKGYHPVAATPGHSVYYLWVLSGESREMRISDDPDHAWIRHAEAILHEQPAHGRLIG